MHALSQFIRDQMRVRGWTQQKTLAAKSGLTKQALSQLLGDERELRRMVDPATVEGLARAFCLFELPKDKDPTPEQYAEAFERWKRIILLKSAEAIGVPVQEPIIIPVPGEPADEYVLEIVREALELRRRLKEGNGQQPVTSDPSEADMVPNSGGADTDVGSSNSGERRTVGGPRTSGRSRSRRSDADDPERRADKRTAPPSI